MKKEYVRIVLFSGVLSVVSVLIVCVMSGGFTLPRSAGVSLGKMREEYCAAQVALLKEATCLVADVAAAQEAMIDDMQAFAEGDGAPCGVASRQQLCHATKKTQEIASQIGQVRHRLQFYVENIRLFLPAQDPPPSPCVGI